MEELFTPYDLSNAEPLEIAKAAVSILDKKKASNIKLLRVADNTVLTDYFVIVTANSNTQMKSFADELDYQLGRCGIEPKSIEGEKESKWMLLDYYSVIIHVFTRDARDFYKLEKLWADAEEINIDDLLID
ncbi:MAG: ribosome silencing factor [Clostridia bacterium]|nr:ribosome silencing factor [Clostridia bacterium]